MKEKFIAFMKQRHAFEEFKKEIRPYTMSDLTAQFIDAYEFVLCDGCIFFWRLSTTGIDWETLNKEWKEVCRESH